MEEPKSLTRKKYGGRANIAVRMQNVSYYKPVALNE